MLYDGVPESLSAVQILCIEVVALYGSEHRWDSKEVGRQDDLQLLQNRQARSIMGVLLTTSQAALMRESGTTPSPVMLVSWQQRFTARLASTCSSNHKLLHHVLSSGVPICKAFREEHQHGRTTKGTDLPPLNEESLVRTNLLDDTTPGKTATQWWAREIETKVGAGFRMWWIDWWRLDDGRVGAAA